ncbi:hypothetical protein N9J72_02835 [Candidatus Gracilibacteria bacterium]|nr:hypothetical protein [Candidatus Gracilibacteria bacterium]
MYNIIFNSKVRERIIQYTNRYLDYYFELYQDSGIWSHDSIIQGYENESLKRYKEIFDTLENTLSNTVITYPNNQAIIRWRSKILIVSFRDSGDTRIITDLEIR